jgi:HPt (histidine-containing phosphotransfer) domain-containing protein
MSSRINMDIIQSLRDLAEPGEPDPLKECVDLYLADTPACLAALRSTYDSRDGAAFKRAAHTLKGSSSNLGADQLAELCGELEDMAKTGSFDGADVLISKVEVEFAEVKKSLEGLCANS